MQLISLALLAILVPCIVAEIMWSRRRGRRVYDLRESLGNVAIMVVNKALQPITLAWNLLVLSLVEPHQVFRLPETVGAFLLTFVVTDLAYYAYHRTSHEVPLLWTMHHTHHSSPWMNLTTAVRLNWVAKFVSPLFFMPLVLLGLPPVFVAASLGLGLLYQFFLHTEAVGALGRFEGKLLNTPSAHRVHHGSNPEYIDKNYAGVFIVWDRLFGTYEPERAPVRYGVTTGFLGHNPLRVQFQPLWAYLRGRFGTERRPVASGALSLVVLTLLTASAQAAPGLTGTWTYAGDDAEAGRRKAAIQAATDDMSAFIRGTARSRLEARTAPAKTLSLKVAGDQLTIVRGGHTMTLTIGAKPIEVEHQGKKAKVSARRAGQRLVVLSQGAKARREVTYALSADGARLTLSSKMTAAKLSKPLEYTSTFKRR